MVSESRATVLLILLAFVLSVSLVVTPKAISQMGAGFFSMSRFLIAYLLVSIIYRADIKSIKFKDISRGMILGCLIFLLYFSQDISLSKGSPFEEAVFLSFSVVLIPFLSIPILKTSPPKREIVATFACIIGLCLLWTSFDIMGVASAILIALHIVLTANFVKKSSPVHLVVIQTATATLCSIFVYNKAILPGMGLISWVVVFYAALIVTAWGLLIQTRALIVASPVKVGLIFALQPCFVGLIWISLGLYQVSGRILIGIVLILGGLAVVWRDWGKNDGLHLASE